MAAKGLGWSFSWNLVVVGFKFMAQVAPLRDAAIISSRGLKKLGGWWNGFACFNWMSDALMPLR